MMKLLYNVVLLYTILSMKNGRMAHDNEMSHDFAASLIIS